MSTFKGIVSEFPYIRVDFFRVNPDHPPPLACFLSHIHSDHLQGLESLKSPFVYCSAATRRLLLRMEKYPHRMNFAKGILESRKQTYKHLKFVLKALPLNAPTEIELGPKTKIKVTLFDANHCPGAVMFLIEGDGRAILYTGDIRAEPWWVNSLIRNPLLIPYALGKRRLDCVYLDTTFASRDDIYQDFPTKAAGLVELLDKVEQSLPDSIFHFRAWTLGYEDVWITLSRALESQVHVDGYQQQLYASLGDSGSDGLHVSEAPCLVGFQAGNHHQDGLLTANSTNTRLHSCEPGTACYVKLAKNRKVVWITPIISRTKGGVEVRELGAGGGGGDLYQTSELDISDSASMRAMEDLLQALSGCLDVSEEASEGIKSLREQLKTGRVALDTIASELDTEVTLKQLFTLLSARARASSELAPDSTTLFRAENAIRFPFSRHSSFNELRHLVSAFRPHDICPCIVDAEIWTEELSMHSLFGDLCSGKNFLHDIATRRLVAEKREYESLKRKRKRDIEDDSQPREQEERSRDSFETADEIVQPTEDKIIGQDGKKSCLDLHEADTLKHGQQKSRLYSVGTPSSSPVPKPKQHAEEIKSVFYEINDGRDTVTDDEPFPASHPPSQLQACRTPDDTLNTTPLIYDSLAGKHTWLEEAPTLQHDQENNVNGPENMGSTPVCQSDPLVDEGEQRSPLSVATSAFDSQPAMALQLDGTSTPRNDSPKAQTTARIEAYRAARRCLVTSDSGDWDALELMSLPGAHHGDIEIEL